VDRTKSKAVAHKNCLLWLEARALGNNSSSFANSIFSELTSIFALCLFIRPRPPHDGFRVLADRLEGPVNQLQRPRPYIRFPLGVVAVAQLPVKSSPIDPETTLCDDNGLAVFKCCNGHAATSARST
jgi:hypothetical protein